MLKELFLKQMLKAKGVPSEQIDQVLLMVQKNPDLFAKIAKEIEQKIKSENKSETQVAMEVMGKYKSELEQLKSQ
ncbi:hypothetical protein BK005_01585 [bacterium CG10_37_50]|nr:MAG: hypothetical protein BK005_01585 [bacterium CG10_37_50]